MRSLGLALLMGSVLAGAAHAVEVGEGHAQWPTAQRLIAHEREAWRTYAQRDVQANGRLLAEDYADVQPEGDVIDRAEHLAFVPEANLEWHALDQFHVFLLSPDAALVTYRARSRDRGAEDEYTAAVTSGWSLRNGRWLNTFYRETPTDADDAQEE